MDRLHQRRGEGASATDSGEPEAVSGSIGEAAKGVSHLLEIIQKDPGYVGEREAERDSSHPGEGEAVMMRESDFQELVLRRLDELDRRTSSLIPLGPSPESQALKIELAKNVERLEEAVKKAVAVDRSKRIMTNGQPETPDHRDIDPVSGQQKGYIVLTPEERSKGFVRPVRHVYVHLKCGVETRMAASIAETYARDPGFYSGTFCCQCRTHFPLEEFVWKGTNEQVGS